MEPHIGEIRMFGGTFAPQGYLMCDGSLLPISQYEVLYVLIGTTYGGDGVTTFALPDLRGRAPVHRGTGPGLTTVVLGQAHGTETVTLSTAQMPAHTHVLGASAGVATSSSPVGALPAVLSHDTAYATGPGGVAMSSSAMSAAGGTEPHENRPPSLAINFIIATDGIFPSQA